jgi:hypothetical protein
VARRGKVATAVPRTKATERRCRTATREAHTGRAGDGPLIGRRRAAEPHRYQVPAVLSQAQSAAAELLDPVSPVTAAQLLATSDGGLQSDYRHPFTARHAIPIAQASLVCTA